MYNKILKRPMFNMGGRTYQAQGTGITSGLDTPRRGLVQQPGGYAGEDTREIINTEREEIFRTPEGQNFRDVVSSFGEYANAYDAEGNAKTIGQMGYDQAKNITEKRKLRKDTQDLAELEGLKSREERLIAEEKLAGDLEITKAGVRPLDVEAKKKLAGDAAELLATAKKTAKATNEPIPQHVIDEIEALNILALGSNYYSLARASQIAAEVYSTKEVLAKTSIKQRAELRKNLIRNNQANVFNITKNTILKLIHVTNFNERFNGRLHYNTGRRLNNGFIRLGHNVMTISDRDIIHSNKNLLDVNGKKKLQKYLLDSLKNFKADAIILGHADSVTNETLAEIKDKNKNLKICQWFLDPIGKEGPDHFKNTSRIFDKEEFIDSSFLTTDPSVLSRKLNNSFFIPNPSDVSFEVLKAYEKKNENDLFFAMSHGVHRGQLKSGKSDDRESFINRLIKKNKDIIFDIYGMNKAQPIWGDDFLNKISKSSMGLNLSRGSPVKYYSSDRLAQLMGNGLLTFIDKKTSLGDFLDNNQAVFYDDMDDLSYKINKFKKDNKNRISIAKNGRDFYLKKFNSTLVADFILSKTFDYKSKNKFIWSK